MATAEKTYVDPSALVRLYLHQAGSREMSDWRRRHTPKLGTRSLEEVHVACALELKLRHFPTFDDRQTKLAKTAGLKLVQL